MNKRLYLLIMLSLLAACGSLQPRPAVSSYACMQAARAQLSGNEANDKRLHCLASAYIARQCSISEAYLAGMGKELRDLFGGGDAEWADWQADRVGVHCGRNSSDDKAVTACCDRHGY